MEMIATLNNESRGACRFHPHLQLLPLVGGGEHRESRKARLLQKEE